MNEILDKFIVLTIVVVILSIMWASYPRRESLTLAFFRKETQPPEPLASNPPECSGDVGTVEVQESEKFAVAPLIVRHLTDAATLMVRYRHRKRACTAHLIVWSGAKKKAYADSYFDLGIIEGHEPTDQVVELALARAQQQLDELAARGKRKRRETKKLKLEATSPNGGDVEEGAPVASADTAAWSGQQEVPSEVTLDDTPPESIKLKKFPSVYRGVIKEIGMMTQCKDGREFETFGIRFETPEGIVDAVFGVNLRTALQQASAGVGDHVEILKMGRKTITKGKPPMNLFKIAKLNLGHP